MQYHYKTYIPQNRLVDNFGRHFVKQNIDAAARKQRKRTSQIGNHVVTGATSLFRRPTVLGVEPVCVLDDFWQTHVDVDRRQ